ncbi:serine/threonine-protein kinase [Streptomyces halobius]|uniref:non-specific serine/threonine protein kinase n=1 Tax=Streptomyces halobius TaxID=2879846 RepID=A0ABY4M9T5_9ACTN|nr:serine/threonine-protein kinase [Streptomyces halobius]UQA94143.1 serine/threonine protein kinase [Streptomyces halobius]
MSDLGRLVANRYRLVERIGRGGMGTVWRAEDELLGRHVAVKKLHVPPHLHDDEVQRLYERTRREARSAARITHPNVIVVHDVVDDEGLPCIVMEYIPSVTLGDVLKQKGTLPPGEAARIGRIMAAALRAAHDAGVLHRDVKPANVLLGNDGRIVLTDFGIAVESGTPSLTKTGELVGSIQYVAPERLRSGMAEPGPACDLWSLGATLYQAIEGRPPFHRDTAIETAYAIAAEAYDPPRNAGDLVPVIDGLLVKEPDQRMDAHEAERLLGRAAEAGTAAIEPPTRPERVGVPAAPARGGSPAQGGRGRRGRRALLWSVAAVVAAATVTGGVLLWPGGGADPAGARPSSDHPTSARPSEGGASSGPPKTSPSPLPPLPAGYRLRKAGQGFSVPVPDGWTRKRLPSSELAYIDPSRLVGLRVNVVEFAGSDPLRHWHETEEDQTRRDNKGYERVRMGPTTFRGRPAGYWEFTFQGDVRKYRAVELAFADADGTQYVVYLSAPNAQWNEYRPVFDTAIRGIRLRDGSS